MLPGDKPVPNCNTNNRSNQRARIIDRTSINRQNSREGQENQDIDDIHKREQIDRDAPAAELERSVDRLAALQLADEDEEDGNTVGDIQRDGGQGDKRVEGRCGGDVDEG
jgi:hypothetical protein